jgi:hypothetical protein
MKPFKIISAFDESVQVPFVIETADGTVEFSIPRMTYLPEDAARKMKQALIELDKPVEQFNPVTGEPFYQLDADGNPKLDENGEKLPLMGPPQRTVHEKTRVVAETMLRVVVPAATFKKLQKLTVGELDQIIGHWTEASSSPVNNDPGSEPGESFASSAS